MSRYHMISGGDCGWGKPVYADEWGNIASEEDVERERLKDEIQQEVQKELGGDVAEAQLREAFFRGFMAGAESIAGDIDSTSLDSIANGYTDISRLGRKR